jgi:DNA-binding transcriptional MerR regulator
MNMEKLTDLFTTVQASQITGFSVRQLDYWARSKLLVPSMPSQGSGTRRYYNFSDLVRLSFIRQLTFAGWSTQKIRRAIQHFNTFLEQEPEYRNARFVADKQSILIFCETAERQQILFDALCENGQQIQWIVIELLMKETQKQAQDIIYLHFSDNQNIQIA